MLRIVKAETLKPGDMIIHQNESVPLEEVVVGEQIVVVALQLPPTTSAGTPYKDRRRFCHFTVGMEIVIFDDTTQRRDGHILPVAYADEIPPR